MSATKLIFAVSSVYTESLEFRRGCIKLTSPQLYSSLSTSYYKLQDDYIDIRHVSGYSQP